MFWVLSRVHKSKWGINVILNLQPFYSFVLVNSSLGDTGNAFEMESN